MNEPTVAAVEPTQAADAVAPLTLEYLDIDALGMDPTNPTTTTLMSWCVANLQDAAVRPDGERDRTSPSSRT